MTSPYADTGAIYRERDLSVMPCAPGMKVPGAYADATGWRTAYDWQKYCDRLPSVWETSIWDRWPDAGICLALGKASGASGLQLVAVDIDTEEPAEVAAIRAVLPGSPVRKRGAKGETEFYLAAIEVPNRAFNAIDDPGNPSAKRRMLDLLGHGRQTVLPPTIHPDTVKPYVWTSLDTLENFDVADLPVLPADIADRLSEALAKFGHVDPPKLAERDPDAEASTHRQLNDAALASLGAWIPELGLYKLRQVGNKYKAVSHWRGSSSGRPLSQRAANLAIAPDGIKDCGEGKGYTPLDLVMAATGGDLDAAFRFLQERVAPAREINLRPATSNEPANVGQFIDFGPLDDVPFAQPADLSGDEAMSAERLKALQAWEISSLAPDHGRNRGRSNENGKQAADPSGETPDDADLLAISKRLRSIDAEWAYEAAAIVDSRTSRDKRRDESGLQPIDLWQRYEAPELPMGVLPPILEQFALELGQSTGCDPAGFAMSALATCAAAIPDQIYVQMKLHDPSWKERPCIWVGLIGGPSTGKSPIIAAPMRPLSRIDELLMARNAEAEGKYCALPAAEQRKTPKPIKKRHVITDVTVESVQGILRDSPHGIIAKHPELSGFFGSMDRYTSGKGGDRAFWLQAYDGGAYNVDRVTRGAAFVPNLSVCFIGGIQPEPLRKFIGESADDGLIQRFLTVMLRPKKPGRDVPMGSAVADYDTLIGHLVALTPPTNGPLGGAQSLRFCAEARAIRERLEVDNASLVLAIEAISGKLAAHFGKHDGLFGRLCVIWHCVEHAGGALPLEISQDTAARVAQFITDYLRPSAIAFYAGELGMTAGHETLMALAAYIVSEGMSEISARDMGRATRELRAMDADEARRLLEKLESFGWLDRIDPPTRSKTPRWRVNPAVHTMFAERGREESERRAAGRAAVQSALGYRP